VMRALGFTLVELLISMALLSMVVLIGASAVGLFGQHWDGQLGNFDAKLHQAKNRLMVQDALQSLMPFVAFDREGRPVIFFEGNRNGFVGVSSKSVISSGDIAVVRFSIRQRMDLSFDVLYEEWPMNDRLLDTVYEQIPFSKPMVLFESVEAAEFSYYGLSEDEFRRARKDEFYSPKPEWLGTYNSAVTLSAPLKASLNFKSQEGDFSVMANIAYKQGGLLSRYKRNSAKSVTPNSKIENDDDENCYC
jgi:prepilin-type N-terminal cleavage/methylation domain-containing protein